MFVSEKNAYIKDWNALRILMSGGGGGVALMHVYVWEHIVSLYYRTAEWIFKKLGRDKVLMALHMHSEVSTISTQGWIQGDEKIGHGGPLLQNLLQTERLQQQTECIAMI